MDFSTMNWTAGMIFTTDDRGYGNICETADERVIVAYTRAVDNSVQIAFASGMLALLAGAEVFDVDNAIVLATYDAQPTVSITLLDGKIRMIVNYYDSDLGVYTAEYWEDSNGTGIDLYKVSDIPLVSSTRYTKLSLVNKLGNGDLVVILPRNAGWGEGLQAFYSSNDGASWTAGAIKGFGIGAHLPHYISGTILPIGTDSFITERTSSASGYKAQHWTDSGASVASMSITGDWNSILGGKLSGLAWERVEDRIVAMARSVKQTWVLEFVGESETPEALLDAGNYIQVKRIDALGGAQYGYRTILKTTYAVLVQGGKNTLVSGVAMLTNAMQTMSRLVQVVQDDAGSMVFNGQGYKFVKTIAESEVTWHEVAGTPMTYTYAGPSITVDEEILVFLASGVTDHSAWGGYSGYTNETSRTVIARIDREDYVNFYYILPVVPVLTTDEILNETLLKGFATKFSIVNIGTSPVSMCGFVFSNVAAEPDVTSGIVIQYGPGAIGTFQTIYNGKLNPDITYYVRAFGINESGIGYGNVIQFMIQSLPPAITNIEVTNTTEDGFSIKFSIDELGALSANVGFVFGKEPNPRIGDNGITNLLIGTVTAPQNITFDYVGDIEVDVPYYLTGYGINGVGEGYGADLTFTLPEMYFWQFIGTPRHARLTHKNEDDHPQYAKVADLANVENDYSGADMIGVTAISDVTGDTVQSVLETFKALIGAAETGLEMDFTNEDPWVLTHNLHRLISLVLWEKTADGIEFGIQTFGTTYFGGLDSIFTMVCPGVAVVTQQGLDETIITWGTNKTGKVVYR